MNQQMEIHRRINAAQNRKGREQNEWGVGLYVMGYIYIRNPGICRPTNNIPSAKQQTRRGGGGC